MTKQDIQNILDSFVEESDANLVSAEDAIDPEIEGMVIFETPVIGYTSADDWYFDTCRQPHVVGEHHKKPIDWLPEARTVISFFLPFSEEVAQSNAMDKSWPSDEWLHGRIEGQMFVNEACLHLQKALIDAGYPTEVPGLHPDFHTEGFTSNWSERHVAYACGLGTFGISAGIITKKGMAGRIGSVVTALELEADGRPYSGVYQWCGMCGMCISNCPVGAISAANCKANKPCSDFLNSVKAKHAPRYGCGKCQVAVPCEHRAPGT